MGKGNEMPKGWKLVKLGDICFTTSGGTPSRRNHKFYGGNIPWVKSGELDKGLILDTEEKITEEAVKQSSAKVFPKGTLLIALYGATIGKLAFLGVDAATNQAICGIYQNENIDTKFLYNLLFHKKQDLVNQGIGGAQPNISQTILKNLEIPLPPLSTQHLIVAKIEELFSELDKGIEDLKLAQQQLKTYRQSVLKWAFEGKLTNSNIKEGELPKGWTVVTITELVENYKNALKAGPFGSSLKKEFYVPQGYKIYGQEQVINDNAFYGDYYINKEKYQELSSCKIKPFDILISLVGTVGKVLLLPENCEEGIINPRLVKISLDRSIYLPIFFKYYFESSTVKIFYSGVTKGTTMDVLNLGIIKTIPFPLPKIEEQYLIIQEIESRLYVADKMEESITQSLQQAEALRQSILKKAFEGKLILEKKPEIAKPKNVYFHQLQVLGWIAKTSKQKGISHGEMTTAKYAYLVDKIYGVPTFYDFKCGHLGPYPIEMKKAINNKEYFKIAKTIELVNEEKLFKYNNPYKNQVINAVEDLATIFDRYEGKERAHKTELLATVCKVVEDIKSTDIILVYQSMREWKIDLKTTAFKNKSEKFTKEETQKCLTFIVARGWDKKLI